jgi:hypothetical protein
MKKTFNVDDNLLREAKTACGASTETETIRLGLEALVRHAAYQRMRTWRGSERGRELPDVPRRREKPAAGRRVA